MEFVDRMGTSRRLKSRGSPKCSVLLEFVPEQCPGPSEAHYSDQSADHGWGMLLVSLPWLVHGDRGIYLAKAIKKCFKIKMKICRYN